MPLDGAVLTMMQISQLLTASWRRAICTRTVDEREGAAAIMQLAVSLLAPLFAALKPHDLVTKKSGVFTLYLYTALAHVRDTVGRSLPTLAHICHDIMEGILAELNRFFKTRTNNVSRGESLVNKEAISPLRFSEPRGRTAAELLIMTKRVGVCSCVFQLDGRMREDVDSVASFAAADQALGVRVTFPPVRAPSKGASVTLFDVPDNLQDVPKAFNSDLSAQSVETVLQHALLDAQRHI